MNRLFVPVFLLMLQLYAPLSTVARQYSLADSLVQLINKSKQDEFKVDLMGDLAWELRFIDADSSIRLLNNSILLSQKLGYSNGIASSYNMLGIISKNLGRLDEAIIFYGKALEVRISLGDKAEMAKIYNNLGIAYRNLGQFDLALANYLKSLTFKEAMGDSAQIANAYLNIGVFYYGIKEFGQALNYFKKCLPIYRKLHLSLQEANTLNNIASIYQERGDYSTAIQLFLESISIKESIGDSLGVANSTNNLGIIYNDQQNYTEALFAYSTSLLIMEALGDKKGIAGASNNIGFLYKNQGKYQQALEYLEKSYALSQEIGVLDLARQSAENLSSAYALLGRYEEALHYHQRFTVLKDSLVNEEKAKEIGRLEASFEAQKEIDAKAAEVRVRTYQRNATFVGLGLVSLLAFVVIRGYHYRQRAARLLADQKEKTNAQLIVDLLRDQEVESLAALMEGQEQERKRIASDLHDRLGSKLATVRLHVGGISEALPANKELQQYDIATRLLDEACQEVRQIAHNMASGVLTHFGLVAALHEMAETLRASGRLDVQVYAFEMEGRRMESRVEIALYRVTQELISNVLKHARATEVAIHLTHHETSLNVIVEDNGSGFVYDAEKPRSSGMGLGSIRHRIESLGGQLTIDTAPAKGTAILIDLPMETGEQLPA